MVCVRELLISGWCIPGNLDLGIQIDLQVHDVIEPLLNLQQRIQSGSGHIFVPKFDHHLRYAGDRAKFIEQIREALYASKICSYAQGFVQLQAAAIEHYWPLNFGNCALLWRGGCIIRAVFLDRIK